MCKDFHLQALYGGSIMQQKYFFVFALNLSSPWGFLIYAVRRCVQRRMMYYQCRYCNKQLQTALAAAGIRLWEPACCQVWTGPWLAEPWSFWHMTYGLLPCWIHSDANVNKLCAQCSCDNTALCIIRTAFMVQPSWYTLYKRRDWLAGYVVMNTSAAHAGLVHDATDTDCQTPNGSNHNLVFVTFNRPFWTRPDHTSA